MLLNKRCTSCNGIVRADGAVACEGCGRYVHDECKQFEQTFDCLECAEELDVGAVEL